jgi:vacuolar protein sorting-associated protein 45
MYLNFGDLGQNAKEYVEQYASKRQGNKEMNSVADMKKFVEEYPEFRKLSSNVTKHITLVGELSRRVGQENLLDVSELEQSLACNDSNHTQDVKTIQKLLADPQVNDQSKLRLVAIYALRYNKNPASSLPILSDLLKTQTNLSASALSLIPSLLTYHASLSNLPSSAPGGAPAPLFQSGSFFDAARSRIQRGLKGVENVYTQHAPRLEGTLQDLIKGKLKDTAYPFVEGGGSTRDKPQDIIVFMVGGTTYEEARTIAGINASTPGVRIVLGGTATLNSETFAEDLMGAVRGWGMDADGGPEGRLRNAVGR